jgi:hypothetical protein
LSAKAQALAGRRGAQADIDTPVTLVSAFKDANFIFAVSDFYGLYGDPTNKRKKIPGQLLVEWVANHEAQQLKGVIDAAAKVEVFERLVSSFLSNAIKKNSSRESIPLHAISTRKLSQKTIENKTIQAYGKGQNIPSRAFLEKLQRVRV